MKGISCCGDCGYYNWKKHKCSRCNSVETDPRAKFYDDCPLPDVVEVKHGEFVITEEIYTNRFGDKFTHYIGTCSVCGKRHGDLECTHFKYCSNCGAKMDTERKEK